MIKKYHLARLEKLADHLESDRRGHKKFDFGQWTDSTKEYQCGTAGCAIGECPVLFPESWAFKKCPWGDVAPALKHTGANPVRAAEDFFGLTEDEALHLFVPTKQDPERLGGKQLAAQSTPKQVASNIRAFVRVKRAIRGD